VRRRNDDCLDQVAGGLEHLLPVPGFERLAQGGDPPRVDLGKVRVQGRRRGHRRAVLITEDLLPCPKFLETLLHARVREPVLDGNDQVRDLPLDDLELILLGPGAYRPAPAAGSARVPGPAGGGGA
jgi:hypothetical protein